MVPDFLKMENSHGFACDSPTGEDSTTNQLPFRMCPDFKVCSGVAVRCDVGTVFWSGAG